MNRDWINPAHAHIRSGWNQAAFIMRGPLTDKKIEKYALLGFYSAEFRQARKEFSERKTRKLNSHHNAPKREGNFLLMPNGNPVYAPL